MAVNYTAPPAATSPDFNDPRAALAYLFNPNAPLSEVDTAAAEGAVASGGMTGSPFAANSRLRLRDSERLNRLQIGEKLLDPFLQRDWQGQQNQNNIQAQAASDALRESGLNTRLSAEGQQRLQLALLQGDQQAADRLLTESGLDRRSSASLAAGLQESTQRNQTSLLQSLLPFAFGGKSSGGGGGAGGGGRVRGPNDISTGNVAPGIGINPSAWSGSAAPNQDVPHWGDPNYAQENAGGGGFGGSRIGTTLGPVLDKILRGYGLS